MQTWDIGLEKCKEIEGEATLLSWHSPDEVDHVTCKIDTYHFRIDKLKLILE